MMNQSNYSFQCGKKDSSKFNINGYPVVPPTMDNMVSFVHVSWKPTILLNKCQKLSRK